MKGYYAPINVNPVGGSAGKGGDLMPETIPAVGLMIVRSDPVVGTFDFDRSGYQIRPSRLSLRSRRVSPSRAHVLSCAHYFQAPATQATRGFLKVTLLEKGVKSSFV